MKKQVGTINVAPTPTGYTNTLILILTCSPNPEDKEWARQEITKLIKAAATLNPEAWGKE